MYTFQSFGTSSVREDSLKEENFANYGPYSYNNIQQYNVI